MFVCVCVRVRVFECVRVRVWSRLLGWKVETAELFPWSPHVLSANHFIISERMIEKKINGSFKKHTQMTFSAFQIKYQQTS